MDRKTCLILIFIVGIFGALIGFSVWQNRINAPSEIDYSEYKLSVIKDLSDKNDYDSLDLHNILPASEASGGLEENIIGNKDAQVIIYEYADYPCSYCAMMSPLLNKIVEDYKGKVAIVFRSYILSYHEQNGVPAASAANAAAIQGYWKPYKDLLFNNQNDWFYSTGDELQQQLEKYFKEASDNKGDLEKFREDMKSESVAMKIAFDRGIGEKLNIGGTPWLYMDGEWIDNKGENGKGLSPKEYSDRIRNLIDKKLK